MAIRKFTADIDMSNGRITNLSDPASANDAATKQYVDNVAAGLSSKVSCRAATTADITIATALNNGDTLDGITLATNDRVLVKDQADASENGIYVVAASPGRSADMNTSAEANGALVSVTEGTANADTMWYSSATEPFTLDTGDLTFSPFTAGASYTAGDGLTLTGNDFDVNVDGTTIEIASDTVRIAASAAGSGLSGGGGSALAVSTDGTTVEVSGDNVRIAATAAGAGLTGGGGSALAVGAGTGITVNANDVAVTNPKLSSSQNVGNGSSTSIAVTHNLGTRDVEVEVYDSSTFETVEAQVVRTSTNVVTLDFNSAPGSNAYRVVILG